jgi:hypothetical protein
MEYAPSYVFQRRSLPEQEQNFGMILASLVSSLVIILYMMECCHVRQVSYKEDETKQELSQPRMLLQKGESFMLG